MKISSHMIKYQLKEAVLMCAPSRDKEKKVYTKDQKAVLNKYGKIQKGDNDKKSTSADFFRNLDKRIKEANR
ncbi:hypothetical protein [Salipaludibacillus sp. CF4.18]|uniref:hypothetical protein n=1 Tax=Salipaludibacillus sp. CF4.18 TaxID=3373081 RepID=UPI003EE6C457